MVVTNDRIITEQPSARNNRGKLKFAFIARIFLFFLFHFAPILPYVECRRKRHFQLLFKSASAGAFSSVLAVTQCC